ncbi:MAG: hypothetical protein CMA65_05665 [Euryarchaeota archaeon]|nr:hypothetical protein [Euryarchaeota archaeon]
MTGMLMRRAILLAALFIVSVSGPVLTEFEPQKVESSSAKATGVDVTVSGVSVQYTSSTDKSSYEMFSSNYPISNFNRPAILYVIDTMVNVSTTLTVEVENLGTANSGVIDVNVVLKHNEYSFFELNNTTVQMSALNGGQTNTVNVVFAPGYSGNHTLTITATSTVSDDNPSNDAGSKGFTVGSNYFNCDTLSTWTTGNEWGASIETAISKGMSCHIGRGSTSTYSNGLTTSLISPPMDMSDAISSPLRTNGFSFFYTGSTAQNDVLKIYAKTNLGAWTELLSLSNTIDGDFGDGVNWQTFSISDKGAVSPLIPMTSNLLHSTSQIKFEFSSDASGSDIGYWLDDIVFVYDQKVRMKEYQVSAQGVATNGATPGEWGSINMKIVNDGNISETFIPSLQGLPSDWNAYYSRLSGTNFNPEQGLTVAPGAPVEFRIMIQPEENASIGLHQMSVLISSQQYASITATLPVQFLVKADRIPVVTPPPIRPSCPPSYTCTFEVGLDNIGDATDVFDISYDSASLPTGWDVGFTWTQATSIQIRPNEPTSALMTMTVPSGVAPDTVGSFDFTMRAQNDSLRTVTTSIDISASMVSDASVDLVSSHKMDRIYINAGEEIKLTYEVWNNASRQDIFDISVLVEDQGTWIVEQPTGPPTVLNSGGKTTFDVYITAPNNAQAEDRGPRITPLLESQRSFMTIQGEEFDSLRIRTTEDITIETVNSPAKLTPSIPNVATFLVTNNGNGDTNVLLEPIDFPQTWDWWMVIDGENHTGPLSLTVSYDLGHTKEVELWLLLPMEESAGERHTIQIRVDPLSGQQDMNTSDNTAEFTAMTDAVHNPILSLLSGSTSTMAGGVISVQAHIENQGNTFDNRLSLRTTVYSTPSLENIKSFLTVGGASKNIIDEVPLTLSAGQGMNLSVDILVPDDASLNTRFVIQYEILGSVDENGFPTTLTVEHLVILDYQRRIDASFVSESNESVGDGLPANIWANHTSVSTVNESMILTVTAPDGWQVTCDKILVPETGLEFTSSPGHVNKQTTQSLCEILRLKGVSNGDVVFTIRSGDGYHEMTQTVSVSFDVPDEDAVFSNVELIGGGLGGVVFICVLLLFLRRTPNDDESILELEDTIQSLNGPPTSGPPVSGPPASGAVVEQQMAPEHHELETTPKEITPVQSQPPTIPETGLPPGWSEEQWAYYGQQYLDGTL